jgi:hypothetical protein
MTDMTLRAMLAVLGQDRCTFEECVGAFCLVATVAHALGNHSRRDLAVELAARLASGFAEEPSHLKPNVERRAFPWGIERRTPSRTPD